MKKRNAVFSWLTFLVMFLTTTAQCLVAQSFNDAFSPNGSVLWVVGNNGVIYRSSDAGNTFAGRSTGSSDYNVITGHTNLYLWIAGSEGALLRSTNAGLNFTSYMVDPVETITGLSFTDASSGWASTATGKIYKTTNGGVNWQFSASPVNSYINGIKLTGSGFGYAFGKNGILVTTSNSGANWNLLTLPVNTDIFSAGFAGNVVYASTVNGIILKSTNSGSTWLSLVHPANVKPDLSGLNVVSANTVYSAGEGGSYRRSVDGGFTFTYHDNPSWTDIKKLYFYDSASGWAIGSQNNIVMRTINGGVNWYMPSGSTVSLSWVQKLPLNFYTSSGNVFYQSTWNKKEIFVTKANTIYRTMDVGETWQQIGTAMPYGAISNSLFVSPKDTNIILVAIDSIDNEHGKVLRSTNYGQSWQVTFSANRISDGIPMAIDPNHPDTIYYGPTDSVLFRSTDFGLTWSQLGSHRFENNCAIKVLNKYSNIILVGSANFDQNGLALVTRSTDFGQTWTVVDSNRGPYPEVPAIIGSPLDSVIYVTQYRSNSGGVKRSTDLGRTWINVNIDITAWGFDRAGNDPNAIIYAPWDYTASVPAYISFNKGATFTPLPYLNNINNFSVYFYNRNNILLQQAIGFYKLKADISFPIGIQPVSGIVPSVFELSQNYPNPFNPSTVIKFDLPGNSYTKLEIFDINGRKIDEPVNENLVAGSYHVTWNAHNLSSGVYFYVITAGKFSESRKMILLK